MKPSVAEEMARLRLEHDKKPRKASVKKKRPKSRPKPTKSRRRKPVLPGWATREQVLASMGFRSYGGYLKSKLWKSIRGRVYAEKGKKCSLCDALAVQIHHRRYDKKTLSGEDLTWLEPVCLHCHEAVEFNVDGSKRKFVFVDTEFIRRRTLYDMEHD